LWSPVLAKRRRARAGTGDHNAPAGRGVAPAESRQLHASSV